MKYSEWLCEFIQGKQEVPTPDLPNNVAAHSVHRYIDDKSHVWETAITYTGRLVVRSGAIGENGVTVTWGDWVTQHDVEL